MDPNEKRDVSEPAVPREVFSVNKNGYDFHFTHMGCDEEGRAHFKLGLGDGQTAPIDRRQDHLTFNNFYFSSGGIDFLIQSVESMSNTEWSWGSTSDSIEIDQLYNSVNCYTNGGDTLLSNNYINFHFYDGYIDESLSAGIMSPFVDNEYSGIRDMQITGGIGSNSCGNFNA